MTAILRDVAAWAASARAPASARRRARLLLMDQIGVSVAGGPAELPVSRIPPLASIWSSGVPASAGDAALVNRFAGDDLELNAGPEVGAAGMAAAEVEQRTLGELDEAIAIACEVEDYVRSWLQPGVESHGLHPPAVFGAVSAAAVAARMFRLEPDRFAGALASACSLAPVSPYVSFSRGATGKRLYGAWSQMLGLRCASLAGAGIGGPPSVLEGSRGIGQAFLDAGGPVEPPPFAPRGWAVERVTFKAYPASRACHAALTAIEALGAIDAGAIDKVDVWTYPFAVELDRRALGDGPIAAQMSLRKTVALFLLHGTLDWAMLDDPRVRSLAARVVVHEDPERAGFPRVRRARVRVRSNGGEERESVAEAKWSPSRPATEEELRTRFLRLTEGRRAPDPWLVPDDTPVSWLFSRSSP